MLRFFDVDPNYTDFLQQYDKQIPNIRYNNRDKFLCGVVLEINGHSYYAPVSSFKTAQKTNFIIEDSRGNALSSIRFCFMFPASLQVLTEKNIDSIADQNYKNMVTSEYFYCKKNEETILQKAESVYKIGCNKQHQYNYTCCDFKKLESIYMKYTK